MRKTLNRITFVKGRDNEVKTAYHNAANPSRCVRYGESIAFIKENVKPFIAILKFIKAVNIGKRQLYLFEDLTTKLRYYINRNEFLTMIDDMNGGIIVGLFNPTQNSASTFTLEYVKVDLSALEIQPAGKNTD